MDAGHIQFNDRGGLNWVIPYHEKKDSDRVFSVLDVNATGVLTGSLLHANGSSHSSTEEQVLVQLTPFKLPPEELARIM